jgi:predicted MFS family arabinose efflux permease
VSKRSGAPVLAERDFRLVLAAWGLSALGDFLALVALTLRVEEDTGSGLAVAGLLVAFGLPFLVFQPIAGWMVDRLETRWVLAVTAALQALVAVGLALVDGVGPTIALAFLLNCGAAIERPALFALLPRIVGEDRAPRAYAWFESVKYATFTAGMLAGGVLTGAFGATTALLVDAATFALTALAALALHTRRAPAAERGPDAGREPGAFTAGVRLIFGDGLLRPIVLVIAASLLFGGIDNVTLVFFAKDSLDVGDAGYGALVAAWGVGMVAGASLLARRVGPAAAPAVVLGAVLLMGAAIAVTSVAPMLALAIVFLAAGGVGNGLSNFAMRVLLQSRVPDELRGRVYSAYQGIVTVSDFVALAAGGVLVSLIGPRQTLAVAGVGCIVAVLLGLPGVRRAPAQVAGSS